MTDTPAPRKPYRVLAEPSQYTLEEKRSLFHTHLFPVTDRDTAMAHVQTLREREPGASHYCWAYLLGPADQPLNQAFSDDGEPSGTAGKPMLNVLTQRGAGDTLAVIVRIFGGTKLGAGGLVRAYSGAVSKALDNAHWREVTPTAPVTVGVDFAHEERVRHLLSQQAITLQSTDYQQRVWLHLAVPDDQMQPLEAHIRELTSGQYDWQQG